MTTRRLRKATVQVEALERRETPSSLGVGHSGVHASAVAGVLFRGNGRGTESETASIPNGFDTASALNGIARPLGTFTGAIYSTATSTQLQFTSEAVFVAPDGDELGILFSGTYKSPRAKSSLTSGKFAFTVIGGTGVYAGASGSGTITSTLDLTTGDIGFKINGRIIE